MTSKNVTSTAVVVLLTVLALVATLSAQTQTLTVLFNFSGPDGTYPQGPLLFDQAGNLYGTTIQGGTAGYGTVFNLDPSGNESVLASFGGSPGAYPNGGLVRDTTGNLYGSTSDSYYCQSTIGCGNVFKLDPSGTVTVLHRFGGTSDGAGPNGHLVLDNASGFGEVFKLTTPEDFAVPAFTLTPASVPPGMPASATLNLAAISGFTDTVAFTCSVSPRPAQAPRCSVTPASATPGTPVTVMVTTTGPSARLSSHSGIALYAMWLPLLGLAGIGNRFRVEGVAQLPTWVGHNSQPDVHR